MDRRGHGDDNGSVRRARERIGAGLNYVQPGHPNDPRPVRSPVSSPTDPLHQSTSQVSAPWPLDSHHSTTRDIRQPPLMARPPSQPTHFQSPNRPESNGELLASFKFPEVPLPKPQVPSPTASPSRRSRDLVTPPSARRPGPAYHFNTMAQVSPIVEEGPDASLRSRSTYSRASSGVLANFSTPNLAAIEQSDNEGSSRESTPRLPTSEHRIVRQASLGKKAKPAVTTIRNGGNHERPHHQKNHSDQSFNPKRISRQDTIAALSAAVANGIGSHCHDVPDIHSPHPGSGNHTPRGTLRMPFADTNNSPPLSPRSMHTAIAAELEPPRTFEAVGYGSGSTKSRSPLLTPNPDHPRDDFHFQFQPPRPGLSEKIPSARRPPHLEIESAERASATSLADLIKRATKLASNLDRGKTASRLGMLDMFYGEGERPKRRDPNEKRESGISGMLGAFPGTPRAGLPEEKEEWPAEGVKMSRLPSRQAHRDDVHRRRRKRCCGMSLTWFITLIVVLVVVIAAAVLIPVFLILVPRSNKNASASSGPTLATCQEQWKCDNGGRNAVVAGTCGCVCAGGWTGSHCTTAQTSDCITGTVGGVQDATMGQPILNILQGAKTNFSVPLDSTTILGIFSINNLACADENSLVNVGSASERKRSTDEKRFYPMPAPGLDNLDQSQFVPIPVQYAGPQATAKPVSSVGRLAERDPEASTVGTSNGIVYQAATTTDVQVSATAASAPATTSSDNIAPIPETSLEFAQVVVLYVLEQSATLSVATNARAVLETYLLQGGSGSVEVGFGALDLRADFGASGLRILWGNGTVVGA